MIFLARVFSEERDLFRERIGAVEGVVERDVLQHSIQIVRICGGGGAGQEVQRRGAIGAAGPVVIVLDGGEGTAKAQLVRRVVLHQKFAAMAQPR